MPRVAPARTRRTAVTMAAAALMVAGALLLPLSPIAPATEVQAAKAAGGSGRYVQAIEWFEWGAAGATVANGTRTNTYTVAGQQLAITCTMANLSAPVLVYSPGSWSGDAFDDLYNSGSTEAANTLDVGLRPNADGQTRTFDLACSSTFGGAPMTLGGLVFADAEQSGNLEHVGATAPTGATWRIIDRSRAAACTQSSYAYRPETEPARLELYGPTTASCASGPAAVAFAEGAQSLSRVTIRGGGLSAIAVGVMVTLDFGDAPGSYGEAGALLQAQYSGGTVATTSGAWSTTNRGQDVFASGFTLATPTTGSTSTAGTVGATIDGESSYRASTATADDTSGIDDEDAHFSFVHPTTGATTSGGSLQVSAVPGATYSTTVSCTAAGAVRGWIDWQRDGRFTETADASQSTTCASGSATLTWTVPTSVVASPAATPTYLRLRTGVPGTTLQPTGVITAGEVEDHAIVIALPALAVEKTADPAEATTLRPGQVVTYSVTVRNTGGQRLTAPAVIDDLSQVLSNATFGPAQPRATLNGAATTAPTRSGDELRWSGAVLAPGDVVVITYAVTVTTDGRGLWLDNGVRASAIPTGGTTPITATDEVVHPIGVAVTVDKRWTIDGGAPIPNGMQPAWLSAVPSVSGQSAAAWGATYEGYAAGSTVQIGETVQPIPAWMPGCSITSQAITDVNGATRSTSIAAGPAAITLTLGLNRVTVTNAVTCTTTLSLAKTVVGGAATPGDFTLTATGPTTLSGPGGSAAATGAITADAAYTLAETGPAVYAQQGGWACVPLDRSGAPVAGSGWTDAADSSVQVPLGMHARCTAANATAQLTLLQRVVDGDGQLVADDFTLRAQPAQLAGLDASVVPGQEQPAEGNTFLARPDHAYGLSVEASAPHLGLRVERYLGAMGASGAVDHDDAALWRAVDPASITVAAGEHGVYRFVAEPAPAFQLPISGGLGADGVQLVGGAVFTLALLGGLLLFRRRGRAA